MKEFLLNVMRKGYSVSFVPQLNETFTMNFTDPTGRSVYSNVRMTEELLEQSDPNSLIALWEKNFREVVISILEWDQKNKPEIRNDLILMQRLTVALRQIVLITQFHKEYVMKAHADIKSLTTIGNAIINHMIECGKDQKELSNQVNEWQMNMNELWALTGDNKVII